MLTDQKKFYRFSSTAAGLVYLTEEDIDKVLCVGLPKVLASSAPTQTANRTTAIPNHESLPGAGAVLYLDFDGQTVSGTLWNTNFNGGNPIVAAASTMTTAVMTEIWKLMSEDFRPFALNVTTSETVFNSAPVGRRMRVIYTPTTDFYPGAGGVAYVGSFTWGATSRGETPCWVFNEGIKGAGEAGSHEAGHTLGLSHDGRISPAEEYFAGQGSWAPIMGVGYDERVVQFSKGEYPSANNTEDDLLKISTQNGFGYRPDDHGNTMGTATPLVQNPAGNALAADNGGIIETRGDEDVFRISIIGGSAFIRVEPIYPDYLNLVVLLTLRDSGGTIMATTTAGVATPLLDASLDLPLAAGTYYLSVDGGTGSLGADSDYGSLGAYTIAVRQCAVQAVTRNVSVVLNAAGQATVTAAQVDNGSTASCGIASRQVAPSTFTCANIGSNLVTLTVTDNSGNSSTAPATVTVSDGTAPTVVTQNVSATLALGTASITAAQVDNGSTDNCGIASRGLSRMTFSCADLANSPILVTLTVTDDSGNASTGTASVTVVGTIPVPTIAVTPSTSVFTGGIPTNLYLGYGPQSATLTASGGVSYAWSPAAGLSNPTIANPVFTATMPGTFAYTVTATSASGCTATASVTLTVVNARCGSKNDKVLVCHRGNTLCIASAGVPAHLNQGNQLGACPAARLAGPVPTSGSANELAVYPNPAGDQATVSFRTPLDGNAQVMVYNALGQRVASLYEGAVSGGQLYAFPLHTQNLATGLYQCRLVVDDKAETRRLIIAR
ncbi:T9SS type A sorting domain-containing protein [Hymenobacter fastidiosus]|uniref:T9SS type A sorting domain-containing protein n=1 Tax=Hymenobacter fastidiosus TaxID=486264 RepID=UPI0031F0F59E